MDHDSKLGEIKLSILRNGITIVTPTPQIGLPFLDRPDSTHLLGANFGDIDFFNGFIFDIEIHNIILPQVEIDFKFDFGISTNNCGPF
jgi:hypothetical protein